MEKCKLCRINDANQTGAHIFTHFLIKSAINNPGMYERDQEIVFSLDSSGDSESFYFGKNLLPEQIATTANVARKHLEKAQNDHRDNINFHTIDYFFCQDCEKRFQIAENYFNDKLYKPLKANMFTADLDKKGNHVYTLENQNSDLIRLNIYIQIWRASVTRYDSFQLKSQMEEKLRGVIDNCLIKNDLQGTLKKCKQNSGLIRSIPLVLTYANTAISEESTTNIVYPSKSKIPYFLFMNEFYIQLYEKANHVNSTIENLFGINDLIDRKEHVNLNEANLKIGIIDDNKRKIILNNWSCLFIDKRLKSIRLDISRNWYNLSGKKPSKAQVTNILGELMNSIGEQDFPTKKDIAKTVKLIYDNHH